MRFKVYKHNSASYALAKPCTCSFQNPLLITSTLNLGGSQIGGRLRCEHPCAAGNESAENEEQLRTEWRLSARAEEIEPIIIAIIRLIRRLSMSNRRTKESETNPL